MTHLGEAHDRPQTVPNGHRLSSDRPRDRSQPSPTVRRVTVPKAAEIFGTTTDAVRSRMRRGKLHREVGEDGTVYVLLEAREADGHDGPKTAQDGRATGNPTVEDGRETVEDGPLVESMRDQIEHLRGQLEEAHAANRENRRIIAGLIQRVPELEAPRDESQATLNPDEGEAGTSAPPDRSSRDTGVQRRSSWWRRFFGFDDRGAG